MIAYKLGKTLEEAKDLITATEFRDWVVFFRQLEKELTADQIYLSQISANIAMANSKKPKNVKLENFFIDFSGKATKRGPLTEEERVEYLERSKLYWEAIIESPQNDRLKSRQSGSTS